MRQLKLLMNLGVSFHAEQGLCILPFIESVVAFWAESFRVGVERTFGSVQMIVVDGSFCICNKTIL